MSKDAGHGREAAGLFANQTRQGDRVLSSRKAKAKREAEAVEMLDRFAGRLSEHGDVRKAAAQLGMSEAWGKLRLRDLRRGLGWQAA